MALSMKSLLYIIFGIIQLSLAQIEFDETLLEHRKDGLWLVEFYAPWCGHCKKLEPIYHEVFVELRNSPIRVGKVDGTRFSSVASEFDIRGFPTIIFIDGDKTYTHRGDRTKDDIVQFALKAQGPAVRKLASVGRFNEAKSQHSDSVFFLYIGQDSPDEELFTMYSSVAEKYIVHSYFYAGQKQILSKKQKVRVNSYPTVLVFKDGLSFEYQDSDGVPRKSSLESWVKQQKFTVFPKVSGGGINEMADSGKYLVIVAVDENANNKDDGQRVKLIAELVAKQYRHQFDNFQFLWMPDVETVNSISMSFFSSPAIIVLHPETHLVYSPEIDITELTIDSLKTFLTDVVDKKVEGFGGTGFIQKLKRLFYDLLSTVLGIWQASRWLFLLMFGLPTVIISVVCYSLCYMEPIDDLPEESDEDEIEEERIGDGQGHTHPNSLHAKSE
ncbi:protein disulfide-isomerase TMX3-like [Gigantopelta aegis]|uniref:protein disulfide-isomerase TMX3-like n=1 Tax=Gigantopelta aegis TaxID=1735272 RepID=UPI001B88B4C9|nr:protein disulfide-isomerase TMX3-like [Gigantopelta aegis]